MIKCKRGSCFAVNNKREYKSGQCNQRTPLASSFKRGDDKKSKGEGWVGRELFGRIVSWPPAQTAKKKKMA